MVICRDFMAALQTYEIGKCVRICVDMRLFRHSSTRVPEIRGDGFISDTGNRIGRLS